MLKINKKGNAYAALVILCLIAALFMGYYVMMKPFATIYNIFDNDEDYNTKYLTEVSCSKAGAYWNGTHCNQLSDRAKEVMGRQRATWLVVPFIAVLGFILWYLTVTFKDDHQRYN